jgi:hypothetical protein
MNAQDAETLLRQVLTRNLGPEEGGVCLGTSWGHLGDELDLIEFCMAIEKLYPDVEIPDEHSMVWVTLQDTVNYLEKTL